MNIYNSDLWLKDIDKVVECNPCIGELSGKSVLITGICGLVCSAVADVLIRYNETHETPIVIFAAARSEGNVKSRFGKFSERPYFRFIQYDATKVDFKMPITVDYIIHGASNSSPDRITVEPVETMMSNIMGLCGLLNYAKKRNVRRLLYISSSEVYGVKKWDGPICEGQYGHIDLLNSRNSYSVGKCAAETMCVSFTDEYNVETVIVRPGHIYGPTATMNDSHVSSLWAFSAARGENILMKSDGAQLRSYCYCLDAATAILTVLLKGEKKSAYNISNSDSIITIKEMAEILAKNAGVNLIVELPTDEEKKRFNPMSNASLDSTRLVKLGWKSCFSAKIGFQHTIRILTEINAI